MRRPNKSEYPTVNRFIEVWQGSKTFDQVVKTLRVDKRYASSKATTLRSKKIPLKRFKRTSDGFDVKALIALAKRSLRN